MKHPAPDVVVYRASVSIVTIAPRTAAGRTWCAGNLAADAIEIDGRIPCEPRYWPDIADGMIADGLQVHGRRG